MINEMHTLFYGKTIGHTQSSRSYVYQEQETNSADKYAEVALQADRYNPSGR